MNWAARKQKTMKFAGLWHMPGKTPDGLQENLKKILQLWLEVIQEEAKASGKRAEISVVEISTQ